MIFRGISPQTLRKHADEWQAKLWRVCKTAFAAPNVDPSDPDMRAKRFFEEACELFQAYHSSEATGVDQRAIMHKMVDYVCDRPRGEAYQEVGGVMVTVSNLCAVGGMSMYQAWLDESNRIAAKFAADPEFFSKRSTEKDQAGV